MRQYFVFLVLSGLLIMTGEGYAVESCLKCHGTKEKLSGLIKKAPAKTGDELVTFLRTKSPKKALHNGVTDDQIRQAFSELGKK